MTQPLELPDTRRIVAAITQAAQAASKAYLAMGRAFVEIARTITPLMDDLRAQANTPTKVAALGAHYWVTAGMDPTYATDPSPLIQAILRGQEGATRLLTPENRCQVACAALQGWVTSYGADGAPPVPWHRFYAGTILQVGAS